MRIRTKLVLITGAFFVSVLVITSVAMWTMSQIATLKRTIDTGNELIAESKSIRGLLRDLLFGMFSPQMYVLLEDVTYAPRTITTPREWMNSVGRFKTDFDTFMRLPTVLSLLRDTEMHDKYTAAMTISRKAFLKINALNQNLKRIQSSDILGKDNVYQVIQSSSDDQVVSFFDEVRSTSYYLINNFESFLDYFLRSLTLESDIIQRQMLITFIAVTVALGLFTVTVSLYFARRITGSIGGIERTIRQVSLGDFSAHLEIKSHDEFGLLSDNLNIFIKDLKRNVDSILNLMRDIGAAVTDRLGIDSILALVVGSVVKDLRTSGAGLFLVEEMGSLLRLRALTGCLPFAEEGKSEAISLDDPVLGHAVRSALPVFVRDPAFDPRLAASALDAGRIRSLIAIPLIVSKRALGVLIAVSVDPSRPLNDLDFTNLSTFADYTALTMENFSTYTELIERREAEYQALQSQVQPHFLYNVLAGLVGLNRLGDRQSLERSILALKDMLRYTIEHQEWTTVEEEFQFLRKYCDLQKLRFHERFEFRLSCDDRAARCRIPKLLLQPLVENAVIHGIEPLDRTGHLAVTAVLNHSESDPVLSITVSDDGVGFAPGPIEKHTHIGLHNVQERVGLAFGRAAFRIRSRPGAGTVVEIEVSEKEL